MEHVKLIAIILLLMTVSFVAIHFWVFICDCIIGGIKRLFGFSKKKERIHWHTLDEDKDMKKEDIAYKKIDVDEYN